MLSFTFNNRSSTQVPNALANNGKSLFLKTYYPREFMVAVLNNYGGFYNRALYVHELRKSGAVIHLPCVNHSDNVVSINGVDVYLGFVGVHGLDSNVIVAIPEERRNNGPFEGLEDFIKRTGIGREQTITLIRVGAFRFTGKSKKELLWKVHLLTDTNAKPVAGLELFNVEAKNYQLPALVNTSLENAYHELELLGFPLSMTMFDLFETDYRGEIFAGDMSNHIGQVVKMVGQYVCEKTVHTKLGQNMWFGTFLDPEGNFFDTTHVPNTTPSYPFRGAGCYLIMGKIVEDFGFPSIEVMKFGKLPIVSNPVMS